MISQETVQQILQAADVVDVIGDFVSLKKRGANMIACCPFHNEKTPSFYVSPVKQIYKCFGCGKAGDPVRFIMDIEGISYPEALRWLAKRYGITIEERVYTDEQLAQQNEKESVSLALQFATNYYIKQLLETEEGQSIGLSYFRERGFSAQTIQTFELGYSPDAWDAFTSHALSQGYSLEILEKAGLTILREGKKPMDRFRGRVMFPIHQMSGKPIAFGARILKNDPNAPKYLNSPETPVYHKTHVLYGISQAKAAIRQADRCFLVEGYTDVLALHQAGIQHVVASSGTSLTKEQIQLIRRFTPNITVLYDGDAAGIKASLRGIDLILEEGMNVKAVVFPDGDDPDSYLKKVGSAAFIGYLDAKQQDFIRFKTEISLQSIGADPIKRAELIGDLVQTVAKIPDGIKRAVYTKEIADLLQIDEQVLIAEGNKQLMKQGAQQEKKQVGRNQVQVGETTFPVEDRQPEPAPAQPEESQLYFAEEECVRLLVCYGDVVIERNVTENMEFTLADYYFDELKGMTFTTPIFEEILAVIRAHYEKGEKLPTTFFTSHANRVWQKMAIDWLTQKYDLSENWATRGVIVPTVIDKLADLAYYNILRLKKARYERDFDELHAQLMGNTDPIAMAEILKKTMRLKEIISKIAGLLGTVVQH